MAWSRCAVLRGTSLAPELLSPHHPAPGFSAHCAPRASCGRVGGRPGPGSPAFPPRVRRGTCALGANREVGPGARTLTRCYRLRATHADVSSRAFSSPGGHFPRHFPGWCSSWLYGPVVVSAPVSLSDPSSQFLAPAFALRHRILSSAPCQEKLPFRSGKRGFPAASWQKLLLVQLWARPKVYGFQER